MLIGILAFSIGLALRSVFLLLVIWLMIKIQKLQYNFPGLLGAAVLAGGLDMIPFVGRYLAIAALVLCLLKITREDYIDVAFTVGVSWALLFGLRLFVLGPVMNSLQQYALSEHTESEIAQLARQEGEDASPAPPAAAPQTKPVAAPAKPVERQPDQSVSRLKQIARKFSLKGLTRNANSSMATIDSGVKTYTLALGETVRMDTAEGRVTVSLEQVNDSWVALKLDGEQVLLSRYNRAQP